MTNRNDTEVAHKALPLSKVPLADFDTLNIQPLTVLKTLVLSPAPSEKSTQESDWKKPIQITLLGTKSNTLCLGVSTPDHIQLARGVAPGKDWLKTWKAEGFENLAFTELTELSVIYDELDQISQIHQFLYEAVVALMDSESADFSSATCAGLAQLLRGVRDRQRNLQKRILGLIEQPTPSSDNDYQETL